MKKIYILAVVLALLFCITHSTLAIRPAVVGDVVNKGGGIYDVRAYGATGDGVTDDYTSISNAATVAAGQTLEFKAGTYKIGTNISLDETVLFHEAASLSIDVGVTVTITGTLKAGLYQVFTGAGTVSLSAGACAEVYPEWWGAVGDNSTDCTAAFNSAMTAAQTIGRLKIPGGIYRVYSPLQNFPTGVFANGDDGYIIEGCGTETVIDYYGSTGYAFEVDSNDPADQFTPVGVTIRDINIRAAFITDPDLGGAILVVGSFVNIERITTRYVDDATGIHVRSRIIPVTESGMTNDANRDFTTTGAGATEKYAIKFTSASRAQTLKDAVVRLGITGAPAGTVHAEIWTDVAGSPGAQVSGGDSDTITINTISNAADGEDVTLDFGDIGSRPQISRLTDYWLVISTTGYTYVDGVTELRLRVEAAGGAANTFGTYDFGGVSWSTSADGANYTANCRYGQALMVNVNGCGFQSAGGIGRAYWVEDSCFLNITNCYADGIEGIKSEYGYLETHNVYLMTSGRAVYATGWTRMFGGVIEGSAGTPLYFGGIGHTHRLIGVGNSLAPVTWESGTWVSQERCDKDFWWSDFADVVPDRWSYQTIPAQSDNKRWDTSGAVFAVDADALNGNASQLNAQNEYIQIIWGATKIYDFLARGTYKATMWMKDTNQVANDMIVRNDFYDGAWNTDFENTFTLSADYKPYTLLMRLDATQNADISYQKRIWLRKATAAANTISVSHVVIEYIGPDIVGDQNVIAVSTDRSNADGSRESQIEFWGSKADGYQAALGQIMGQHDGTGDDYKGTIGFKVNSGGETYDTLSTIMALDSLGLNVAGLVAATTVTGANVTTGADPGHTHTGASLDTIDISDDTNLAVTAPITLTDDTVGITIAKDIVAGTGLTGGEDDVLPGADADTTLNVGAGDGIDVAADSVAVDVTDILGDGLREDANDIEVYGLVASDGTPNDAFFLDAAGKPTAGYGLDVTGTMAATTVTGTNVTTGADPGHTHTGASIALRLDQVDNMAADKTFNNSSNSVSFNFTDPSGGPTYDGAFEIQASGAFVGDLFHVHQHTGNPGVTDLVHFEAEDSDVLQFHLTHAGNHAIKELVRSQLDRSGTSDNDETYQSFYFDQDGTVTSQGELEFGRFSAIALDVSEDTEDFGFTFDALVAGVLTEVLRVGTTVYVNNDLTVVNTMTAGDIKMSAGNIEGETKHLRFNLFGPNAIQTADAEVCIWPVTDAAITISKITVTLDAVTNEILGDLKYADAFIGLATPVVINDFDTTSGVRVDSSMASGAVAAGKAIYISFDSAPHADITQVVFDVEYSYD